ncbi:MAG: SDR family NAD(P)-dependent oxidoreductase [Limisphaerales bacterium]
MFTTPNVFPPIGFEQKEIENDPDFRETVEEQNCYICKKDYSQIHHFLRPTLPGLRGTGIFSSARKSPICADASALLTGGRVKIGYQAGIKLLRAGVRLVVTTRFPRDSAMRYSQEPDFSSWKDRLEIFGLDLRHTPSVEAFCRHMMTKYPRLDFIINNACQTVRRPAGFFTRT